MRRACPRALGLTLAVAAFLIPVPPPAGAAPLNVEVVVEKNLYESGAITPAVDQYLADVRAQGYAPILTTSFASDADPAALRAHLAARHAAEGLEGAVFIGRVGVQSVYTVGAGGISSEMHPCDLYFTDLDGSWTNSGQYSILPDTHTDGAGDIAPEIWLGRLTTWNLVYVQSGRTEAGMLNAYFAKNHAYRTGALRVPSTGLAYTDDDWDHAARAAALALAVTGPVADIWNDPALPGDQTTAADYKWRLGNQSHEHVLLSAHSSATGHSLYDRIAGVGSGSVSNSDLAFRDPENLFYHLFACSAARYTEFGYIAGEYVFGDGLGLVAVGPTKTGGMMSDTMPAYFGPLGEGATFGEALREWWYTAVDPGGHTPTEAAWYYGMTLIGDPLLLTQGYMPEPGTAVVLLLGAGVGLGRGRRGGRARGRAA